MTQNERVKEIRKTLGLTLEKFGERIGVTRGSMSNIENGNRNLTEQMTKSICPRILCFLPSFPASLYQPVLKYGHSFRLPANAGYLLRMHWLSWQ